MLSEVYIEDKPTKGPKDSQEEVVSPNFLEKKM